MLLSAPAAAWLRERLFLRGDLLYAPHMLDLEVMQVLRRHRLAGERAAAAIRQYRDLRINRYPHHWFIARIWEMRSNFTAYDAMYVALAEVLHSTLITSDLRLAKAAARFVDVETP